MTSTINRSGVAILEISALGAALVILDALEKAANVRLLQAELNDYYGYMLKITGDAAALRAAVEAGNALATEMQSPCVTTIIDNPDKEACKVIASGPEYQPLIEQEVVFFPKTNEDPTVASSKDKAIGLIETQGLTAVFEAIDTACKAADVEILGKEKLGGGYITVFMQGDVASVKAAIEAGQSKVDGLGKLIAAHVIARPSAGVRGLLPKSE